MDPCNFSVWATDAPLDVASLPDTKCEPSKLLYSEKINNILCWSCSQIILNLNKKKEKFNIL